MICAFCGEDHSWMYCRKKPADWNPTKPGLVAKELPSQGDKRSTEAKQNSPVAAGKSSARAEPDPTIGRSEKVGVRPSRPRAGAKSTAVRTDAPNQNADGHGAVNATEAGTQAPPVDIPKRGRPRIHPDRKAYKAEHERKRRAKAKPNG